jgi:hypothetical protein
MSLSQTSLEDAYGGKPFGGRAPVRESFAEGKQTAKQAVDNILPSLPIDETPPPKGEGFRIREEKPSPVIERRERFTERPVASADEDKISRILRLIEQNRTGYERPAVQDMVLYVFTGVFFLFTLDTFVMIGKTMRKVKGSA